MTFASQSIFSVHNSLSNNLGSKDVGHIKSMGSKILCATDKIVLFVIMSVIFKFNTLGLINIVSFLLFHKIPKTRVVSFSIESCELSQPRSSKSPVLIIVVASDLNVFNSPSESTL